jgi:hypothetical protein
MDVLDGGVPGFNSWGVYSNFKGMYMPRISKCDCKKCCFDLVPKITGGSKHCWDICIEYPITSGYDNPAVTDCKVNGLWTYYLSDRPDFSCKFYVNRRKLDRGFSKGKICQYQEIYQEQLYENIGHYREELAIMWDRYNKVIDFGISKLPVKLRESLLRVG